MTAISLKGVTAESAPSTPRGLQPTGEQSAAIDIFKQGDALVLEALAGSGKTTSLKLMSGARPHNRGLYVAYNRAIADDAKGSFPNNTSCSTAHSLAYRDIGKNYRGRLNGPRVPAWKVADILNCEALEVGEGRTLRRAAVARIVMETVGSFCNSADHQAEPKHVPFVDGLDPAYTGTFRHQVAELARRAWSEHILNQHGRLPFTHDCYLKIWALGHPRLPGDFILLDEAQDANPVIADVVLRQSGAQLVAVGDENQAIYGWRGAVDAMREWPAEHRLPLSQSFRFGPAVAERANGWLGKLRPPLRVRGFDRVESTVRPLADPRAVLCRTNAQAVAEAMAAIGEGKRTAIVGGVNQIRAMAQAAGDLKAGRRTDHRDLCAFESWAQVQDYVHEDSAAADLKVLVGLVDGFGVGAILEVTDRVVDEQSARLIVSTAHKAKGREWPSVRIAPDFRPPKESDTIERSEARLAYVAVTRAQLVLDDSALTWATDWKVA